ncbi:MAG: ATP-dependent zinc metalloprotease FtsH [Calditrichaeota bacterium]|nr:ATP-dependent zinc metalloprotease FtsH [Calditrichota bacterium]
MPDKSRNSKKKKSRRQASSGNAPKKDENFQWRKATRTLSFWLIIIIVSIFISQRFSIDEKGAAKIGYSRFRDHLENSRIEEAIIADKEFLGKLKSETTDIIGDKQVTYLRFKVILPEVPDDKTAAQWIRDYGVTLRFEEISNDWWNYVFSLLPWILFGVFWIFILRRMQGGGPKGIFSFGKSRAKLLTEDQAKVTFDDVAGADEAKQELREIIDFLKDPDKFQKLGGKIPKGALLLGPPGTGKTLLARAVAGEAGVPFFTMSGADFVEMFVGVGASRVRDLFEQGKKNAPCIIFIDEIDAVGRHRGAGLGGGHDEREQTLNQLLVEMDGFESNEGVILIAATNRPDVLDSALLRPGRFDRQIVVDRPDVRGREGILKVHTSNIPIAQDVDLSTIAKGTPGFSGADLANLANEAALLAARYNKKVVEMSDFEYAKDKVMMGVERKSLLISEDEKKLTAFHEAGHVVVAKYLPESDAVHKVTIIPRGRAMGITNYLPGEKHSWSKKYCETVLAQMLGGRAAELVVMKELTTGAGNDIERATALARKMVCEWGMSEKMGPLTFGKKDEEIFIAREIGRHQDHSEKTSELIDAEMKRIVEAAEKKALAILEKHVDKLHAIANALLEREILDGVEIDKVLAGQPLEPIEVKENSKKSGSRKRKENEVVDDVK